MNRRYVGPDGWAVTLHMASPWMRVLGRGVNKCVTLSARHILVSRDWITANGLAHEWGHVLQARRLGWRYLPWVLFHYVKSGYARSLPETEAEAYREANVWRFRYVGSVPRWAA